MSTTKDPAATDRERALQALMIVSHPSHFQSLLALSFSDLPQQADLGSDRRNKCTTVDAKRARFEADAIESQRRIHVEGSEAHRRFENDEDLLNKWNRMFQNYLYGFCFYAHYCCHQIFTKASMTPPKWNSFPISPPGNPTVPL